MKFRNDPLWEKIQAQPFGPGEAILGFARRLARENGWTQSRAERVLAEYRRFLFLAARAGHPVTPSDAVDQAWHLHLVYTDDYWNVWCAQVLRFPFHHGPTRGGSQERAKYADWYGRTCESYREWFGEEPPADIWPSVEDRFRHAGAFRRVNTQDFWLVPRPRVAGVARALGLSVAALAATGCGVLGAMEWNVFDWTGGPFLVLYGVLMVALGLILAATRLFRGGRVGDSDRTLDSEDPYVVAGLMDGARGVLHAGLAALAARGLIESHTATPNWVGRKKDASPGALSGVEEVIWAALPEKGEIEVRALRKSIRPMLEKVRDEVAERGWEPTRAQRRTRMLWRWGLVLALVAFGAIKVGVGVSRDRPVGILVVMGLFTLIFGSILAFRVGRRTRAGIARMAAWRNDAPRIKASLRQQELSPDWSVPMMVGLFGGAALAGTALGSWQMAFNRPPVRPGSPAASDGDAGCSGGWSDTGSSIGGGSDGGGGSSDGGGGDSGCGGCGGCGGGGD